VTDPRPPRRPQLVGWLVAGVFTVAIVAAAVFVIGLR